MFGGRGRRGGCCAERKASACRFTSKTSVLSHLLTSLEIETEFPVFEEMSQEVLDFLSSRAFFFDRLSPTSIVDGCTRAVPCRVEALVHLFPETRDGLHPPWTLRSNVGPSCRIDRDRHITAFVAVESFSSPTAAISVKTIARLRVVALVAGRVKVDILCDMMF